MSTYKNQINAARGGVLSRLGAIFGGGGTPSYVGDGQPSHVGGGLFGTPRPTYKVTTVDAAAPLDADAQMSLNGRPMLVIDPEALAAAGKIVLIVPHGMCPVPMPMPMPMPMVDVDGQDACAQGAGVPIVMQQQ